MSTVSQKKRNMSSPDMIMIHLTGGKAPIIRKTKNYVGSTVDPHFIIAIFFLPSEMRGCGFPRNYDIHDNLRQLGCCFVTASQRSRREATRSRCEAERNTAK